MARPPSTLPPTAVPAALAYLRRAAERRSAIFKSDPASAHRALLELQVLTQTQADGASPELLNDWLAEHVTAVGRRRLVDVLRRKRADQAAKAEPAKRRTLAVPTATLEALEALAAQMDDLPVKAMLAAFVELAQADPVLREQVQRHAKAGEAEPKPT